MPKIFFNSSMPRAGSTLLQNILAQNPDIHASPTSGMMELIYGARANYTSSPEFTAIQDKEALKRGFAAFCDKGIHSYAEQLTDKPYYVDKSRSWAYFLNWVETFMPYTPKVICMVRDLREVFCSMEKMVWKNPDKNVSMIDWQNLMGTTVEKRMDIWANTPPIGVQLDRLKEVIHHNYDHKILFIRYEDLCLYPDVQMRRIYDYLEIPHYAHNFDDINQYTHEDDTVYGEFGDHIIRNRLELTIPQAQKILGYGVCQWIVQRYKWYFDYFKYTM